jgi:hypothetical protein
MNHHFIKLTVTSTMIFVASAAEHTAGAQSANLQVACAPDIQKFCPGLVKKESRQCLKAHRAELSAGCTAFFEEKRARRTGAPSGGPPRGELPPGNSPSAGPSAGAPSSGK